MKNYETAVVSNGEMARTLRIYAPKHADRAIIMHDGRNVFFDKDSSYNKSWRMIEILKTQKAKNIAVIGIDVPDATRYDDYTAFAADEHIPYDVGGKADAYLNYLKNTVIPYLDKRFGYKKYAMLGSSAGALATISFAALNNPRFCAYGLFSTALLFNSAKYAEFLESAQFDSNSMFCVYVGGNEHEDNYDAPDAVPSLYVNNAFSIVNALRRNNVQNLSFIYKHNAVHDEVSWRLPTAEFVKNFSALPL